MAAALLTFGLVVTVAASLALVLARSGKDVAAAARKQRKQNRPAPRWERTSSVPPWRKGSHV